MSDLDQRIRRVLTEIQERVEPGPPFPLEPLRARRPKENSMRNRFAPALGLVAMAAVWAIVVLAGRPPEQAPTAPVSAPSPTGPSTTVPVEPPTIRVAASGQYAEDVLASIGALAYVTTENVGLEIIVLGSEAEVWSLLEDNTVDADVIEIGFRIEALSGLGDQHLLPADQIDAGPLEFLRVDANGVVPAIDGALGLFEVEGAGVEIDSWSDLLAISTEGGSIVIPGPPLAFAVVFVWALGDGDVDLGVERYRALVDSGAIVAKTTSEVGSAIDSGAVAGAWTSSGVISIDRGFAEVDFIVPSSGAVALPAFTGVLAGTDHADEALRWVELRFSEELQANMTFDTLIRAPNTVLPVPWAPAIDVGHDPTLLVGFDPLADPLWTPDWAAVAETREDVVARLEAIAGG